MGSENVQQPSKLRRKALSTVVTLALASVSAGSHAQQQTGSNGSPLLLIGVDEKAVVVEGQDIEAGQAASVNEKGDVRLFTDRPTVLDWPCGTIFAGDRGNVPKMSFDDLPEGNKLGTLATNFFDSATVLDRQPLFLNGGSHGTLPAREIDQFLSEAYWYQAGPPDALIADQRPPVLVIGFFYGTGQVIVDNNFYGELRDLYGDEPIPVLIKFFDPEFVPISYFGKAPTPANVLQVFNESGILPAPPPMPLAGDHHVQFNTSVLADLLGAPPLEEIDPERRRKLEEDIRSRGFSNKAVNLIMVPGENGGEFIADEGERLRVAAGMGFERVPVSFAVFDTESYARLCGIDPPVTPAGLLGEAQGEAPNADPPQDTADNSLAPGGPVNPPVAPPPLEDPLDAPPAPLDPDPGIGLPDVPSPELPEDPASPAGPENDFQGG